MRYRLNPRRVVEAAAKVAAALEQGAVVAPVLGGRCVLDSDPARIARRYGRAFRLVPGFEEVRRLLPAEWCAPGRAERLTRVFSRPAAIVLDGQKGWHGVAPADDELSQAVLARAAYPVALGIPEEPDDIRESGVVLEVVSEGYSGPGPAVLDVRGRCIRIDRRGGMGILELEHELGETVKLGPDVFFSVLVVCTGNMCRSSMAAGILCRMLAGERVFIYSAGTDAPAGIAATNHAVEAAAEIGADISRHRSRRLEPELVRDADLVLVMEEYHRRRVAELVRGAEVKTVLPGDEEIADPVGRSFEFYRATAQELKRRLDPVALEISRRLRKDS